MSTKDSLLVSRLGPGNYRKISRKTGLTPQHISRVLRGIRGCSFKVAAKIALAADVDLDDLYRFIQVHGTARRQGKKRKSAAA